MKSGFEGGTTKCTSKSVVGSETVGWEVRNFCSGGSLAVVIAPEAIYTSNLTGAVGMVEELCSALPCVPEVRFLGPAGAPRLPPPSP